MTGESESLKPEEFTRDGEGFGGWDGSKLPGWLVDNLAPYTAEYRAQRLGELREALSSAAPPVIGDRELAEEVEAVCTDLRALYDDTDNHGGDHHDEGCPICNSPLRAADLIRRLSDKLEEGRCTSADRSAPGKASPSPGVALPVDWSLEFRNVSKRGNKASLGAGGRVLAAAEAYWREGFNSELRGVTVSGDGYVRFHWQDPDDFGTYSLPIETLLASGTEPKNSGKAGLRALGAAESVAAEVARLLIRLEDNMLRNDADMFLDRDGDPSPREMAAMLLGRALTDQEQGFPPSSEEPPVSAELCSLSEPLQAPNPPDNREGQ